MITQNSNAILVVEDEPKIAGVLADYLLQSGYTPHCVANGNDVLNAFARINPAAILLDLMLPGKDGITLCREIRTLCKVPILMVTARVDEIERLLGLDVGADDYICKPFSPREVISRLRAILRRSNIATATVISDFALDESCHEVSLDKKVALLTAVEFQLLKCLVGDPGRIFTRDYLLKNIYVDHRVVSDRTIDSHIKKLRRKLTEQWPERDLIQSVYGVGYRFEPLV